MRLLPFAYIECMLMFRCITLVHPSTKLFQKGLCCKLMFSTRTSEALYSVHMTGRVVRAAYHAASILCDQHVRRRPGLV
jgi:hypothetical protein